MLLIFLLISQIGAVPAAALNKTVPAPLPTEAWVGKTSVDYNEKHEKYAEVLVCIWIPLGSLGFCYWFSLLLGAFALLIKEFPDVRKREVKRTAWSKFQAWVTTIWSIFGLVLDIQTLRSCQERPQFYVLSKVLYAFLAANIFTAIGGLFAVAWSLNTTTSAHTTADAYTTTDAEPMWLYTWSFCFSCVAVCGQWVSALLGLLTVVKLQPPESKVSIFIEPVSMSAKSLPITFWIVLSIIGIVVGLYIAINTAEPAARAGGLSPKAREPASKARRACAILIGTGCTLLVMFFATCVGLFGFVFVFLGNVIGSPWGVYYIKNLFGQVTTGFTAIVGVVELGASILAVLL